LGYNKAIVSVPHSAFSRTELLTTAPQIPAAIVLKHKTEVRHKPRLLNDQENELGRAIAQEVNRRLPGLGTGSGHVGFVVDKVEVTTAPQTPAAIVVRHKTEVRLKPRLLKDQQNELGRAIAQEVNRRLPGFSTRSGHVGFVVDKVEVFSKITSVSSANALTE
jgi:hypothetical protein